MVRNVVSCGHVGGLLDINSQGSKKINVNGGSWYRIAQGTATPNYPSSILLNLGNSFGNTNQRHSLIYASFNSYGGNVVSKIAGTTNRIITKVRVVKKEVTSMAYNYLDVYVGDDTGTNILYISASNMIDSKLIEPINVTDQSIPDGYTSVEFDV